MKKTKKILEKLINNPFPVPRKATLKKIYDVEKNGILDEGLILWFPGPQSYTGEDMA